MTSILKDFDQLRKHITTLEGKKIAKDFRKKMKRAEEYSNKLDCYFSLTHDGVEPEKAEKEARLF
jgi:hypothetical protein